MYLEIHIDDCNFFVQITLIQLVNNREVKKEKKHSQIAKNEKVTALQWRKFSLEDRRLIIFCIIKVFIFTLSGGEKMMKNIEDVE